MTDHILSEEEVNVMAECGASIYDYDFEELITSHRLLQKRVTELEEWLTAKHYDWPTPKNFQNPMGGPDD